MAAKEAAIRADVKTVLDSVTNIGKTHDYKRWWKKGVWDSFKDLFKTTITSVTQVRGWEIEYRGSNGRYANGSRCIIDDHQYLIRGFMGLKDADETQKTFHALAEAVKDAINASTELDAYHDKTPASVALSEAEIGGVLCHMAEITFEIHEG